MGEYNRRCRTGRLRAGPIETEEEGFMGGTVELIASDIDGTLLRGGAADIPPEIF